MSDDPLKFAISDGSTFHTPFVEELAAFPAMGVHGIGIWEQKLDGDRGVERAAAITDAGLTATFCFPLTPGIFAGSGFFSRPKDPDARVQMLIESVRRLAVYQPQAICLLANSEPGGDVAESRKRVVDAFRRVSAVAADLGVQLALEIISPSVSGGLATSIPQALDLIDDIGADNIGLLLDNWHITEEPMENISASIDRIVAIQVCDRSPGFRGRFDRALPGDGDLPVAEVIRTAWAAGYRGWYELEIFSDDGTFGEPVEDSMWGWPVERLLQEGKAAFERVAAEAVLGA